MPSDGLFNEERRRAILAMLHRDGACLVKDLARHFRISQITIRTDLEIRQPGSACSARMGARCQCRRGRCSIDAARKREVHRREKARIAEAAVKLVGRRTVSAARLWHDYHGYRALRLKICRSSQ